MKFELDQDYFNRAGDKVRYVGNHLNHLVMRNLDLSLYCVYPDGLFWDNSEQGQSILGKWEITEDPDRADLVTSDNDFVIVSISSIEKILVKPQKTGLTNEQLRKRAESRPSAIAEIARLIDSTAHLKKIEPLENEMISLDIRDLDKEIIAAKNKINELIAVHNANIGNEIIS